MFATSILADIVSSDEIVPDNSSEYAAAVSPVSLFLRRPHLQPSTSLGVQAGSVDPRELPVWDVNLDPPSLEGLTPEEQNALRMSYGPGPVAKALIMCMPTRAGAAAKLGSLQGVHPESQLLKSLVYVAQCYTLDKRRRRFLLQDKEGLEALLLDIEDPVRQCPPQVPHGPEGRRAAATRALADEFSEENLEQVPPEPLARRTRARRIGLVWVTTRGAFRCWRVTQRTSSGPRRTRCPPRRTPRSW